MKKSTETVIDSTRLDQRAWVWASDISGSPEADHPYRIKVKVNNTGKTLARKVLVHTEILSLKNGEVFDFDAELRKGRTPKKELDISNVTLLLPNSYTISTFRVGTTNPPQASIETLKSKKHRIFVYGIITYEDVFGSKHWTTFCSVLEPIEDGNWVYVTCESNDAGDGTYPRK